MVLWAFEMPGEAHFVREGDRMVSDGGDGGVVQVVGGVPVYTLLENMEEDVDIGHSQVLDKEDTVMVVVVVRRSADQGPVEEASGVAAVVVGHHKAAHTTAGRVPPPDSGPAASQGTDSDKIVVEVVDI